MRLTLGLKLAVLLAAFAMLAAGLTGYYIYSASRSTLIDAAEAAQLTATQVLARRFSVAIDEVADDAIQLARQPLAQRLGANPEAAGSEIDRRVLTEQFIALLATNREYFQIRLISAGMNGLEIVRVDRDEGRLTPVTGNDLQEKGHYPYVFKTLGLASGEVHLSDIGINHERGAHAGLGEPSLTVATPIRGENGEAFALIVINVDLDSLFNLLRRDLPDTYDIYLANQWGDFLVHPDPGKTFGFDQGRRILVQDSFPDTAALVRGDARETVTSRTKSAHGVAALASFVLHPYGAAANGQSVIFGLTQPLAGVLGPSRELAHAVLQIVIVFSLLAILLAVATARAVTGPLQQMLAAVRRFPDEEAVDALPLTRRDEIGVLARSFKEMQTQTRAYLDDLHESRSALAQLASHDALTGLANRRHFQSQLDHAIATSRRTGQTLAVLYIDLDNFKQINDVHGHASGDQVLQAVAHRLRNAVREIDTVARLGGDEFVILFDAIQDRDDVVRIAEKLLASLREPVLVNDRALTVQASIGISLHPQDGDSADALLKHADSAMYRSKTAGRDTYHFFDAVKD